MLSFLGGSFKREEPSSSLVNSIANSTYSADTNFIYDARPYTTPFCIVVSVDIETG